MNDKLRAVLEAVRNYVGEYERPEPDDPLYESDPEKGAMLDAIYGLALAFSQAGYDCDIKGE